MHSEESDRNNKFDWERVGHMKFKKREKKDDDNKEEEVEEEEWGVSTNNSSANNEGSSAPLISSNTEGIELEPESSNCDDPIPLCDNKTATGSTYAPLPHPTFPYQCVFSSAAFVLALYFRSLTHTVPAYIVVAGLTCTTVQLMVWGTNDNNSTSQVELLPSSAANKNLDESAGNKESHSSSTDHDPIPIEGQKGGRRGRQRRHTVA